MKKPGLRDKAERTREQRGVDLPPLVPIPKGRDRAASRRPLRSSRLGRRSGLVATEPYPTPRPALIIRPSYGPSNGAVAITPTDGSLRWRRSLGLSRQQGLRSFLVILEEELPHGVVLPVSPKPKPLSTNQGHPLSEDSPKGTLRKQGT